jgi:molybdate transport system ATP-binding protein
MSVRLEVAIRSRLKDFTLDVAWTSGDGVSVLFGPSGAGKTLTLQCLAGLVRPESGRIVLDGRVLLDTVSGIHLPAHLRRLGYVFQGYALFPHLTVRGNIAFGLRDRPAAQRVRRTAEIVERLGLAGLEDRTPRELSGGQRQRVALGRALAIEPALVLLDEPLSALDLPMRRALREELQRVLADFGVPAVLVTHDFTEAYQLADQVIVYEEGRVRQVSARADLLRRPASGSVARILGFRNILRGELLDAGADRVRLRWRGQTLEIRRPPDVALPESAGGAVSFFVRPEDLRLLRKDGPPPDPRHHGNILRGSVVREADFGVTRTLFLRLDAPGTPAQGDYDLEIEVPRFVYEMLRIERDPVWRFSIHPGSVHILPD